MAQSDRKNLGYLGEDFQFKLCHVLMDDKDYFKDMYDIIVPDMFTNIQLKTIVSEMKLYYEERENVPSYQIMGVVLNNKSASDIDKEQYIETLNKVKDFPTDGNDYIKDLALRFFKQQNIVKAANEVLRIAGDGDVDKYDACLDLFNEAINKGTHDEKGYVISDNLADVLSDDYRTPIPTGVEALDEILEGGLAKGEVGMIIGSSGFGKALSVDELVATPNGFVRMGDIRLGDKVIGRDGEAHNVVGVYPQGVRPIYKVSFSDGVECECDMEHLWSVNINNGESFQTLPLKEIANLIGTNKIGTPLCDAVQYDEIKTEDKFILGERISKSLLYNNLDRRIAMFKYIALFGGSVVGDNLLEISIGDNSLLSDILELLNSLGCLITIKSNEANNCAIQVKIFDERVSSALGVERWGNKEYRYIESVEYVGDKEAQCITVDSEDHLYLTRNYIVTHNTSLTTSMAQHAATYKCEDNNFEGYKVLQVVFEDRVKQIQRKHIARITGIEAKDLSKPENKERVKEILEEYEDWNMLCKNLRIVKFPSGEITADKFKRFLKKLINSGFKPDYISLDYFECLSHDCFANASNDYEKEGKTMRKLETIASEFDVALWVPTQGTKDALKEEVITVDKSSGSAKKGQISHIIISISRSMEDFGNNMATIAVLKNRAGGSGKIFNGVYFNNGTCRVNSDNINEFESIMDFDRDRMEKQKQTRADIANEIFSSLSKKK